MQANTLFRLSGVSTLISSALALLAAVVSLVSLIVPILPEIVVFTLMVGGDLFILFGLLGVYAVQYQEAGSLGLVGFILTLVGTVFGYVLAPVGWGVYLLGLLLLAAATTRTKALPHWAMWLWFAGAFLATAGAVLGLSVLFTLGLIFSAGGRAWLGVALWDQNTSQPVPQMSG